MAVREQNTTKSGLVLDSLEIKNFRAFKHLTIEKLGRVNLITGKNGVGKTTLLEALFFYARGGYPIWIRVFLNLRNELALVSQVNGRLDQRQFKFNLDDALDVRNIKYLFYGRNEMDEVVDPIIISTLSNNSETISVGLEWLVEERANEPAGTRVPRLIQVPRQERSEYSNAQPYIVVRIDDYFHANYRLDQVVRGETNSWEAPRVLPSQFLLPSSSSDSESAGLWDSIVSSDLEDEVIKALGFIHAGIESIKFIADPRNDRGRVAVVRIHGSNERIPLRTLGEGISRLLSVALSLVNSRNGFCMLDEIEAGIHYSVLPDVWAFIFQIARRLNVQVFATTHSWECITAFEQAAAEDDDPNSGILVRLQNKNGNVVSTVLDEEDLNVITRSGLEVR